MTDYRQNYYQNYHHKMHLYYCQHLLIALIERFLDGRLAAEDFAHLHIFTRNVMMDSVDERLLYIIGELFFAADCYDPGNPPDEDEPLSMGEQTLRCWAADALQQIETLSYYPGKYDDDAR